jgi:hydrogenase nickel incorporation protein HypA/HybF
MHEYSVVQALLERVDHEAVAHGASRVHRVRIAIGELSGVDVDLLRTAYETIRCHTRCEHADLEVRRVNALWECTTCAIEIPRGGPLRCAQCGGRARLASGDEILLDRIEMETADV